MATDSGRKHRRTRFAALLMMVIAGTLAMGQTAQAADTCMTSKEMRSERVRALQSALMFAALKCVHKPSLGLNTKYNEIMRRHAKDLAVHSKVVQDYFRRTGGRSHRQKLHKYVTSMANRYSVVSFQEPRFCEEMSDLGSSILNGEYDVIQNARFEQRIISGTVFNLQIMK